MNALVQRLAPSVLLTLFAALPAAATVQVHSTGAVEVRAFSARSASEVYAAAYGGGLFRSTDTGANWTRVLLPGNGRYLTSVAANVGTNLRVVGGDEGLYTNNDAGGTNFTKRLHEPVSAVAMGATFTTVLAAVNGLGIMRSTDSGVTFSNTPGLAGTDVIALAAHPSNANIFYASAKPDGANQRGGIYVSTNGGATWTLHNQPPTVNGQNQVWSLAVDTAGSVHAAVFRPADGGGDIYKQTGGAGAFNASTDPAGSIAVHRDANTGTNVWAGTRYLGPRVGAGPSYNYMFSQNGTPNLLYTSVNAFATFPGNANVVLMAIKGAGVWRSTVVATPRAWTRIDFPNADRVLSASGVFGAPTAMLFGLHAGGVFRSNSTGAFGTFNPPIVTAGQADFSYGFVTGVSPFNSVWDITASATNGNWIWAAVGNVGMHYGNDNPGIFRFNGTQWQGVSNAAVGAPHNIVAEAGAIALPTTAGSPFAVVYGVELNTANDQVLYSSYLGGTGVVQRNSGTWSAVGVPSATRSTVSSQAASTRVIALPFDDKPYISNTFGNNGTFSQVSVSQAGFERLRFFQVAENPTNGNNWIGATQKGIFVSNDAGASWTRIASNAFLQQAISAVGFKSTGRAFAADRAGNRYCSANGGATWTRLTATVASFDAGVNSIRLVNGNLFYLTDGAGAFREDGSC